MDKIAAVNVSSTDSFFFQLYPNYFKVEHGFAKNMKSGSTYRLVIYKGIQKVDELAQAIKGKLVGGKIIFDPTPLNFYLPIFSPTRNIQFTIKVYEAKPNEQQIEIAQHKIKSGDYIRAFKNDGNSYFKQQVTLIENLVLVFELYVHNSKIELDKIVKKSQNTAKIESRKDVVNNRGKTPKKNDYGSENLSQSDREDSEGGIFSSKKKLARKRGHDGRMKSRNGSRQNSDAQSEGSIRSSRKGLGPFPHNEQNQRFIPSPKKASPPRVNQSPRNTPQKVSLISGGKSQNLVSVGRKDSSASEVALQKNVVTPSKPVRVQSNIQRSQSAKKSPKSLRSEGLGINNPITPRQPASKTKQEVTPINKIHNLELTTGEKIFDLQHKNAGIHKAKNAEVPLPPKSSNYAVKVDKSPLKKVQEYPQSIKKSQVKGEEIKLQKQTIKYQQPLEQKYPPPKLDDDDVKQQKIKGTAAKEGSVKGSIKSGGSRPGLPIIATKNKPLFQQQEKGVAEITMKRSIRKSSDYQQTLPEQNAKKQFDTLKDKIFYVVFLIVSAILFWNAVTPTRKV